MEQNDIFNSIRKVTDELNKSCEYIPVVGEKTIDKNEIEESVRIFRLIVFGNYFGSNDTSTSLSRLYSLLSRQIAFVGQIFGKENELGDGRILAQRFIEMIPDLRSMLGTDVKAVFDGDPAAVSFEEVIL